MPLLSESSIYILLWNILNEEAGVAELTLDSVSLKAPCANVLVVGTHLDDVDFPNIELLLKQIN